MGVNSGASRLEGLTERYGVGIRVGEATRGRVQDVTFLEVEAGLRPKDRLRAYRPRNWDLAEVNLVDLQRLAPRRRRYQVFLERLSEARRTPMAADWDPVTVFEER